MADPRTLLDEVLVQTADDWSDESWILGLAHDGARDATHAQELALEAIEDALRRGPLVARADVSSPLLPDDGPTPGAAVVCAGGELVGEILVWIRSGYLTSLEQAWSTGEPPTAWPSPSDVRVDES